jgi:D-xylose transport system ATP-binding protein
MIRTSPTPLSEPGADVPRREIPVLSMSGISKRFGAVEALVEAELVVHPGEVVALVGDNAAGKSTLAKVIAGVLQPDAGLIELDGAPAHLPTPTAARAAGVAMVFQELAVCDNLDVAANVFLGHELRANGLLDQHAMDEATRHVLRELGASIPSIRTPLDRLSGGQRQAVAIARTLIGRPRLVVLDEPTASLGVVQTAEVLTLVDRLRGMGMGVVIIGHNLNDLRAVADRVEVLRHGRNNGSFDGPTSRSAEIIAAITGARPLG